MTVAEFVRKYGLPEKRVHWWKKRVVDVVSREAEQPQFVTLQVIDTEESQAPVAREACSLEVVLQNGRVVRVPTGFDPRTLSQVVEVLEVTPC